MRSYRTRHRENLTAATVRVTAFDDDGDQRASGTGFFVADGRVVTCAHVVPAGCRYVVTHQGVAFDAEVLVREPDVGAEEVYAHPDVALLAVPHTGHPCAPLGCAAPEPGRELHAYGCPVVQERAIWEHMTLRVEGEQCPDGTSDVFIKTKGGQVRPGSSGCGAVDVATGELVGMLAQTRDAALDLGGALIPTATILATLKHAGHDIAAANRKAADAACTLAAARRRLRWALQSLVNDLDHGKPTHWRSMLLTLDDDPPDPVEIHDAALALLNLELDDLGTALSELARACRSSGVPQRLLVSAAPFAWLDGRPLVEPDTAARLAAERGQDLPRVVHLPVGCARSVELHATRAAVRRRWEAVPLTAPDAETDEATGLPAQLVRTVRSHLLHALGSGFDPDDPEDVDREWTRHGDRAKATVGGDFLFALPADSADNELVTALRQEFAPSVFVLAGRGLSAALHSNPALLALPASLDEDGERTADERYGEISRRIERAVR